uniref:DENN domain containing 2D n=1 Tax=Zosterops lateralis melanops TaxID=1220523 RepID=A0A8D2PEP8_ZOSLA
MGIMSPRSPTSSQSARTCSRARRRRRSVSSKPSPSSASLTATTGFLSRSSPGTCPTAGSGLGPHPCWAPGGCKDQPSLVQPSPSSRFLSLQRNLFLCPDQRGWQQEDWLLQEAAAIRARRPAPRGFLHHQLPGLLWALLQGREVVALPHCWSWKPLLVLLWVPGSHFLPQILDEVEKRRQISMAVIYPFMQGLRESPFPAPGKTVTIKSFIPDSGTELIELTRPVDAHLEHVEFQALLQRLSPHLILHIFASATLERRLIFLAEELSVLSQCIHAVAALLYPFTWAHTYIPVVPECLLDTVCCPTPFMVGIQMRHLEQVLEQPMEEALIVDLCEGKIIRAVGDEEEILPRKLQNEMLLSLNRHNNNNEHTLEQVNTLVSEAFVHFFVRLVGHYASHIKWGRSGSGSFQERAFCKAIASKSCRRFTKKFVKTNMFSLFIEEAEKSRMPQEAYFQQKIKEYHEQKKHQRDS